MEMIKNSESDPSIAGPRAAEQAPSLSTPPVWRLSSNRRPRCMLCSVRDSQNDCRIPECLGLDSETC